MLGWTKQFNIFCFLDNHNYSIQPQQYECLLAAGAVDFISSNNLNDIDSFLQKHSDWVFGHLSYELKNSIHQQTSNKKDPIGFPLLYFFVPQILLQVKQNELLIIADDPQSVYRQILETPIQHSFSHQITIQQKLSKEQYVEKIRQLQHHILRGDCYEINFCQEFFSENALIDPIAIFEELVKISPNPFSALYKLDDKFLICASPERFMAKKGGKIFSQPMKGTIKRNLNDEIEDDTLKTQLQQSAKDRSENVMVVDLVRNDLTRICKKGSVGVDELFGVYSYPHVHQMISTISGELLNQIHFSEIVQSMFPMGSMTGAPKHRVMELIDQYEISSRGIFSGTLGYMDPAKDFDFNVVIRSIMYNSSNHYLSYQVGSAITFYSDPEKEWEECLLKGEAIKKVLASLPAPL